MSANNWSKCPRCAKRHNAGAEKIDEVLREKYGKVSLEEYEALQREMSYRKTSKFEERELREDWEIGIFESDQTFAVDYLGECRECGFKIEFNHTKKLEELLNEQTN